MLFRSAKPGATVPVQPSFSPGPYAFDPVPAGCVTKVQVTPGKFARVSRDRKAVVIASDAPDGTMVTVRVTLKGGAQVDGRIRVTVPTVNPLAGIWRQTSADCPGGANAGPMIGEFSLRADGRFAVTWMPFETYQDYWGVWSWDRVSGALKMTVEQGNHVPKDLDLEGTARGIDEHHLELTGLTLGRPDDASAPSGCKLLFER